MKTNLQENNRIKEFIIVVLILLLFEVSVIFRYQIKLDIPYYILTLASVLFLVLSYFLNQVKFGLFYIQYLFLLG